MDGNNVLEDLADGEQKSCGDEINHWAHLTQDAEHQNSLEDEEEEQEDEWRKLIEGVESDAPVFGIVEGRAPVTGPVECSVKSDVACADKERQSTSHYQGQRSNGPIVQQLKANGGIH